MLQTQPIKNIYKNLSPVYRNLQIRSHQSGTNILIKCFMYSELKDII